MKKDKKFLMELENNLTNISKSNREKIIKKYANIIADEKAKNRKITEILKELGSPKDVAENELKNVKKSLFANIRKNSKVVNINSDSKSKKKVVTKKSDKKSEPKKEDKKTEEVKSKKENLKKNKKEEKVKKIKISKRDKVDKKPKNDKNKTKKDDKLKEEKKAVKAALLSVVHFLTRDRDISSSKKSKEKKSGKIIETIDKKEIKPSVKDIVEDIHEEIKEEVKEIKEKKKKEKSNKFLGIFKKKEKSLKDEVFKIEEPRENLKDIVEDIHEDVKDEILEVSDIIANQHIFETKTQRRRRILLRTLGVVIIALLLFVWLWVTVVFFASIFAYLDGVKFIGLNIGLGGLVLLLFWLIMIINKAVFKKKNHVIFNLIVIFISLVAIAVGIVLMARQVSQIETVKDVTDKYTMSNKFNTYEFSSDPDKKYYITFNSNYNTQYVIDYDETLNNKFKLEVKYYECYYDYYIKETSNNIYVSLKLDNRDRLSVYIDDLKEGKVYDNDELSRYTVRITVNAKDADRLIIND